MSKIESSEPTLQTVGKIKRSWRRWLAPVLILLVIALAGTSTYFYKKSKNPNKESQAEINSLVEKVGKLVLLPEGETPTVATVSDPEALKGQAFFVDAKQGDKVLIYSNARKAILYSPSLNKVITIAPLNVDANTIPKADTPKE